MYSSGIICLFIYLGTKEALFQILLPVELDAKFVTVAVQNTDNKGIILDTIPQINSTFITLKYILYSYYILFEFIDSIFTVHLILKFKKRLKGYHLTNFVTF